MATTAVSLLANYALVIDALHGHTVHYAALTTCKGSNAAVPVNAFMGADGTIAIRSTNAVNNMGYIITGSVYLNE